MKQKKLLLNKETVANLNRNDLRAVRGGTNTYDSCKLSDICLTVDTCDSTLPGCDCTTWCTRTCITIP